jgi:hypothetical protein
MQVNCKCINRSETLHSNLRGEMIGERKNVASENAQLFESYRAGDA